METDLELTSYEKLVRLALIGLVALSALTLICILPWRGLIFATGDPVQMGIEPGNAYHLGLRVALRAYPLVAAVGLVLGWGLYLFRFYKTSFYLTLLALTLYLLIILGVVLFAVIVTLGG